MNTTNQPCEQELVEETLLGTCDRVLIRVFTDGAYVRTVISILGCGVWMTMGLFHEALREGVAFAHGKLSHLTVEYYSNTCTVDITRDIDSLKISITLPANVVTEISEVLVEIEEKYYNRRSRTA